MDLLLVQGIILLHNVDIDPLAEAGASAIHSRAKARAGPMPVNSDTKILSLV
jgi:hypothetical protein